jgi:hypothetical protein
MRPSGASTGFSKWGYPGNPQGNNKKKFMARNREVYDTYEAYKKAASPKIVALQRLLDKNKAKKQR